MTQLECNVGSAVGQEDIVAGWASLGSAIDAASGCHRAGDHSATGRFEKITSCCHELRIFYAGCYSFKRRDLCTILF